MIYLHRGLDRAIAEGEARAHRLEARGFIRCSADVHRALWRIADMAALVKLRSRAAARLGGAPGAVLARLPGGWVKYRG